MEEKSNKHPGGRPKGAYSKYHKKYCKELLDYFDIQQISTEKVVKERFDSNGNVIQREYKASPCDLPMFERFARNIGVTSRTLRLWKDKHPEFKEAYEKAHDIQQYILTTNCLSGGYNPIFGKIAAINIMQWKDGVRDITNKKDYKDVDDKELTNKINEKITNVTPFKRAANQ